MPRALLIVTLALSACQSLPPFFEDYSRLERVEEDVWAWEDPAAPVQDFGTLVVGPLTSRLVTTGVSKRLANQLTLVLRDELVARSQAAGFEISTKRGSEPVARVRCRIVTFRGSSIQELLPDLEGPPGAALETVVSDARTDEVLATYVQVTWSPAFRTHPGDLDLRGRRIMAAWAEQLIRLLVERDFGGLAPEPEGAAPDESS
jgi:hypothetical protein